MNTTIKKGALMFTFLLVSLIGVSQDLNQFGVKDSENPPVGLNAGDMAPNFMATTASGEELSLEELTKTGAVVLIFYRGAWCPYCMKYLSNVNDSLDAIEAMGAKVVAITPQGLRSLVKAERKSGEGVALLSDADGSIIESYDVAFDVSQPYHRKVRLQTATSIKNTSATSEAVLPVPATYVIDATGMIIYRHFDYDFKNRSTVAEILKALEHQSF